MAGMIKGPGPRIEADGWREHYAIHTYELRRGMQMTVALSALKDKPGYSVSFNDIRLFHNFADVNEAKLYARKLARRVLTEALAKLDDMEIARNVDMGRVLP